MSILADKDDFLYTIPRGDVTTILPFIDGSPAAAVPNRADISFLTEMARERSYWNNPRPYGNGGVEPVLCISSYNYKNIFLPEQDALQQIRRACSGDTELPLTGGSIIPVEWSPQSAGLKFPLVSWDEDGDYAIDMLYRSFGSVNRMSEWHWGERKPLMELDELRRAYYDLSRIKRFALRTDPLYGGTGEDSTNYPKRWRDFVAQDTRDRYHLTGPMVQDDGNTYVYVKDGFQDPITGYVTPMYERGRGPFDDKEATYRYADGNMIFGVNSLFYSVRGSTLEDATVYLPETLTAYINFSYTYFDGAAIHYGSVIPRPLTATRLERIHGTAHPFYGRLGALYSLPLLGMDGAGGLYGVWRQTLSKLSERFPYNENDFSLRLTFTNLIVDSGPIKLNAEIDSTGWDWKPVE